MYHVYGWSPGYGWHAWRFFLPPYGWAPASDACASLDNALHSPPPALADTHVYVHRWDGAEVSVVGGRVLTLAEARALLTC